MLLPQGLSRDCSQAIGKEVSSAGLAIVRRDMSKFSYMQAPVPRHMLLSTQASLRAWHQAFFKAQNPGENKSKRVCPRRKRWSFHNLISKGHPPLFLIYSIHQNWVNKSSPHSGRGVTQSVKLGKQSSLGAVLDNAYHGV